MSFIKRTIDLNDAATSQTTGTPLLAHTKIELQGKGRLPLQLWSVVPVELTALLDAIESASEQGWGFDLLDIERVEAFWQQLDDVADAHGFVLSLRDGRRLYLEQVSARDDDEPTDEIQMSPMGDEQYPQIDGGGIVWIDEVQELNRFLKP